MNSIVCGVVLAVLSGAIAGPSVKIDVAGGTEGEQKTKRTLEEAVAAYDLRKYTFTRHVVIADRASHHALQVLTLIAHFASYTDNCVSSEIHNGQHAHS